VIRYSLIGEGAQWPERHLGAALDLKARLPGRGWRLAWGLARIPTGVALEMPDDMVVRVTGRSGNFMRGILVHDGLIESEFNGQELCALIYCPWPRLIRHGQRIAQMWAVSIDREAFQRSEAPLAAGSGRKAGFGSTGQYGPVGG
jgi:dUTPase